VKLYEIALIGGALVGLCACKADGAGGEMPARIVNPTPESRAELARVVSSTLDDADVTLADDALTTDSLLVIERRPHRGLQHGRIMGRDLGKPEQFRLLKHGEQCILVQVSSGKRWVLPETSCTEE
jgi:hypothetical protein